MKWAMEYHTFNMLILSDEDLSTLSEAVKEFLFSEADLVASSGGDSEDISRASKVKNILPSLKYFFPAVPKPNEKPRPLTNDQKNQNVIFMRELKKLWKRAKDELNNRIIEYIAKAMNAAGNASGGGVGKHREDGKEQEMFEKERKSKMAAAGGGSFRSETGSLGGAGAIAAMLQGDGDNKQVKAWETQCLNELSLKRLKEWIEEDEDKKIAEENEDAVTKLKEAKISHEQFVRKKDGLRIRMPEGMEAAPAPGMSYGREMAGVKATSKGVRTTVELMAGTGLKYVHATSKGRTGMAGDLEKSRELLLKLGHVHKENFERPEQYESEKRNNTAILEKQKLEQKLKEDNVKAYEEWIQQKELKEQALKCLALIPKITVDYAEHQEDYMTSNENTNNLLRRSTTIRRSTGGGGGLGASTMDATRTGRQSIGGQTAAGVGTIAGPTAAGPFNPTMVHFSIANLVDFHSEELEQVIEVGKNLKKVDRTLFVDWMKWCEGVIPTNIAAILWDFFPPVACDVHSSAYSQVRDTFLKLLKPGKDYKETFIEYVHKTQFARRIDRIKQSKNYFRMQDEEKEEVDKEIEELKEEWLKDVALTKNQFNELLATMGIMLKQQELNSLFDAFDFNHDGVITLVEFLDFCGPKREKRSGNSMILNQRCCWLSTCKITGMANGYSISNPTKRFLKNQEEASQKEKQSSLLTKFYGRGESKERDDDGGDSVNEEENYKLNHAKFSGKTVTRKLANGEIRLCIELNERQKREDILRKFGLLESLQKQKKDSEKSSGKGKAKGPRDDYEDDYEQDEEEEHRYSDDDDHDDHRSKGSKNKTGGGSVRKSGGSEAQIEPCDFSTWTLKNRKEGLRYLLSVTKDAREEELLKSMISNGKPPNAPKFWIETKKIAKNLLEGGTGSGRRRFEDEEDRDNYDEDDPTTQLTIHWGPSESTELVSFYSIEYGGPITSTVKKSYDAKYIEIYRDPEDADVNKGFSFQYTLPNLAPGTCYRFRIRAFNGYGPSDYTYKTLTTITTAPLQPKVTKLAADSVTLRWTFSKEFFQRLEELKKIFQLADKDRSGQVDREELTAVFDEKVSDSKALQVFLQQIASAKEIDLSQGYGALFDLIEADDDGGLSWDEFQNFFMSAGWTSTNSVAGGNNTQTNLTASQASFRTGGGNASLASAANSLAVRPGDIVYVVEKCESEFDDVYSEVVRTTSGQATITRLEPGSSYRFRVYSLNADEVPGPRSEDIVVHTLLETPAAPTAVPKTVKAKSITITWKARNYLTSTRNQGFIQKMVGDWAHSHGDKDGGVSIEQVFARYDKNQSGDIDAAEFACVLEDLGVAVTQERLNNAFAALDVNGDHVISFEEFGKWWRGDAVSYVLKRSDEVQPRNRLVGASNGGESAGGEGNGNNNAGANTMTMRPSSRGRYNSGGNNNNSNTMMSAIPEETSFNRSQGSLGGGSAKLTGGGAMAKMTASRANSVNNSNNPKRFGRQVGVPRVVYRDTKTRVDVRGLQPNSLYHFKVRYVGARSNSILSPPLIIMTAPLPPSSPALIEVSCNSVRVKWYPAESGAYKFAVQMRPFNGSQSQLSTASGTRRMVGATIVGQDTGEDGWVQVYNGPDNCYTNTTLSTEFAYELRVFALNYQGAMSEPSPSLVFTTLSRADTSRTISAKTVSSLFTVECTGDVCVGDTILITERLFLRPKQAGGSQLLDERGVALPTSSVAGNGQTNQNDRPASRSRARPSSASATANARTAGAGPGGAGKGGGNNPMASSVTSLHTTMTVENDGAISIHPSNNAQFIGERTFAAIVTKDNYRSTRDLLESRQISLTSNYKEFSAQRKLWLEIVWSKASNDLARKYELRPGEILERFQNHLELFEVFRCPWKQEALRKSLIQEWEALKDCYIDMD